MLINGEDYTIYLDIPTLQSLTGLSRKDILLLVFEKEIDAEFDGNNFLINFIEFKDKLHEITLYQ